MSGIIRIALFVFTPAALFGQQALTFVPVTPCPIVDARQAHGGTYLVAGSSQSFVIAGACGIPATAAAYSLNVTVAPRTSTLGYLTVWPTGEPQPGVSTINSLDGRIKANAAILAAGNGGAVSAYATDATDVVFDINGYFAPSGSVAGSLAFYPVAPCRVADTRAAIGTFGGPSLSAGGAGRTFPIQSSSCGVPATAMAYFPESHRCPSGPSRVHHSLAGRAVAASGLNPQRPDGRCNGKRRYSSGRNERASRRIRD